MLFIAASQMLEQLTGFLSITPHFLTPGYRGNRKGRLAGYRGGYVVLFLSAVTAIASHAQTFTTLYNFASVDGHHPQAALIQGFDGNLYGTTFDGGSHNFGTVYKVSPKGLVLTLYNFCSQTGCTDGEYPTASLIQGLDGNFYGTTTKGGLYNGGVVFQLTPKGSLNVLYNFCALANCTDGQTPAQGLIQASDGKFYGTTVAGGTYFSGTVYKISSTGSFNTLYSFCPQAGCPDGRTPKAGLIQATDGNLYGSTSLNGGNGYGTIFKITTAGLYNVLYNFCSLAGCADGKNPTGLVQGADGNLYGLAGGGTHNSGTLFKISLAGALATLYDFCSLGGCPDGSGPIGSVIQAVDGNFYGATNSGGTSFVGTIFKITPAGAQTTLYNFCSQPSCTDGLVPYAGLLEDTNGIFYGATNNGGTNLDGTLYSLATGLKAFVAARPSTGKVGANVLILGTNLTGATAVSFNGVAATFTVVSGSEIKTAVPAGATSGKIKVTTPHGTFSSNAVFRVKP